MSRLVEVKAWDLSIRIFHWVLVCAIGFSWLCAELGGNWMEWHLRSGYLIAGLLVFRVFWGFGGSWSARFKNFIKGPKTIIAYLQGKGDEHYVTHNPAGGIGALALILLVGAQVGTGLFSNDDIFLTGPLAHLIPYEAQLQATDLHELLFNFLLATAAIHIGAVIYHQKFKNEKLIQAMLHGKKWVSATSARDLNVPIPALIISLSAAFLVTYLLWING